MKGKGTDATAASTEGIFEASTFERFADEQFEPRLFTKNKIFHRTQLSRLTMVVGIGVDIIEIERLENAFAQPHGERLRKRIFTEQEIAYCEQTARKGERYATRFAAKEAARKALGAATPVTALAWHEVEIISSSEGAPQLEFHGRAAELAKRLKITRSHVSLSHGALQAIAFVVLETD
jgi:holo-[acyl-carrier protein] synthase